MLALRLTRGTHPLVLLRRLFVAAASAGVGFLLLCTLGYALTHPGQSASSLLRLLWCLAPLAATVQFAVAVARTDPSTRPRPGLSSVGLGPARLAATAAASTALSCTLGSVVALFVFLHLRGDLTSLPFDGAGTELLAPDRPLPLAAVLVLLALSPLAASAASAWTLRPRAGTRDRTGGPRPLGPAPRPGTPASAGPRPALTRSAPMGFAPTGSAPTGFASTRSAPMGFAAAPSTASATTDEGIPVTDTPPAGDAPVTDTPRAEGATPDRAVRLGGSLGADASPAEATPPGRAASLGETSLPEGTPPDRAARLGGTPATDTPPAEGTLPGRTAPPRNAPDAGTSPAQGTTPGRAAPPEGTPTTDTPPAEGTPPSRTAPPEGAPLAEGTSPDGPAPLSGSAPHSPTRAPYTADRLPRGGRGVSTATLAPPSLSVPLSAASAVISPPTGLPWGVALCAAGLAVETYASRGGAPGRVLPLPGHADIAPAGVLAGWSLTALGLVLAGPGLVHLCGFLLQAVRPGAVRLLAGRVLQGESRRIGRPLGVVCATASGLIAAAALYSRPPGPSFGPLTGLGAALVVVCTTGTLVLVALETRQARAATTQALIRQGAAAQTLRAAAVTCLIALITLFAPLTWVLATLAAGPLTP